MRELRTFNPKWHVSTKSLPWCFRELCERGEKKIVRAGGVRWHQENIAFRHNRTDGHMKFQKPWQHSSGLHRSKPDGFPVLRGEWTWASICDTETFSNFQLLTKNKSKNQFSLVKSHWVYKPQLGEDYMSSNSWPTQNKHNGISGEFLFSSHNALIG